MRKGLLVLAAFALLGSEFATAEQKVRTRVRRAKKSDISLRIMGGVNMSQVKIENDAAKASRRATPAAGLGVEIDMGQGFHIEPGLMFVQKSAKREQGTNAAKSVFNTLEVPVLAKYKMGNRDAKFTLAAGPSLGIVMSGSQTATAGALAGTKSDIDHSAVEFGIHFGAGGEVNVARNVDLFLDGRYLLGLTDLYSDASIKGSSSGLLILTGVRLGL